MTKARGRNSAATHPEAMAKIVDIGRKPDVTRRAVATGTMLLRPATARAIRDGPVEKGDVLVSAEVAALHAMKSVWRVLPHCHPIPITAAEVSFDVRADRIVVTTNVEATYKPGVEMEALSGVTVALHRAWHLLKPADRASRAQ